MLNHSRSFLVNTLIYGVIYLFSLSFTNINITADTKAIDNRVQYNISNENLKQILYHNYTLTLHSKPCINTLDDNFLFSNICNSNTNIVNHTNVKNITPFPKHLLEDNSKIILPKYTYTTIKNVIKVVSYKKYSPIPVFVSKTIPSFGKTSLSENTNLSVISSGNKTYLRNRFDVSFGISVSYNL